MKLHIENNPNKPAENIPHKDLYQLHFHTKNLTPKTNTDIEKKEILYEYTDALNSVEKAFDILFESMLKNGVDAIIDNMN